MRSYCTASQNEHHCDLLPVYLWDTYYHKRSTKPPTCYWSWRQSGIEYAVSLTNCCCHESVLRSVITMYITHTHCCIRHQIYVQRKIIVTDKYFIMLLKTMLSNFHQQSKVWHTSCSWKGLNNIINIWWRANMALTTWQNTWQPYHEYHPMLHLNEHTSLATYSELKPSTFIEI